MSNNDRDYYAREQQRLQREAMENERRRQADELKRNMERQSREHQRKSTEAQSKKQTDDYIDAIRRGSRINDSYSRGKGYSSGGGGSSIFDTLGAIFGFIMLLLVIGIIVGIASYLYPPLGAAIAPFTDPIWIYIGDLILELNPN